MKLRSPGVCTKIFFKKWLISSTLFLLISPKQNLNDLLIQNIIFIETKKKKKENIIFGIEHINIQLKI